MDSNDTIQPSVSATPVPESSIEPNAGNEDIADETLNDGNNSFVLNSTRQSIKRTLLSVEKTCLVNEDIATGKFTDAKNFNKRSTLQKKLPHEIFDPSSDPVFKQHKTGFSTERPLQWMVAMEKYIAAEEDVKVLWMYKIEDDIIYECEISTWFQTTTEVTV